MWEFPQDIVAEQYRELRQYYERAISAPRDKGLLPDVAEFRRMLGMEDALIPPQPQQKQIANSTAHIASLVSWPILPTGNTSSTAGKQVRLYGILITPKTAGKHPAVVVVHDANQSAADITGLAGNVPEQAQHARRLAEAGVVVFAPFFTQRRSFSQPWTDDRSWLFRLGYQVGRHLIGSEVQQVSAAYDFLSSQPSVDAGRIGIAGLAQGGLIAFYAAAVDSRFKAAQVANYYNGPEKAFDEPEDRIIWRRMPRFRDDEVARLIAPRRLILEGGDAGAMSFAAELKAAKGTAIRWDQQMSPDEIGQIANAQFTQWQARYRNLAMEAYAKREAEWKPDTRSAESYREWVKPRLDAYFDTVGRYPDPSGAVEAKSVQLYDEPQFTGYRLNVKLYDGVHAYGILLVPKGMKPGERRPVVFTQHGLQGIPEHALGVVPNAKNDAVYGRFGYQLARRGYIVFAPMISTQTGVDRSRITRRAHLLGLTPVGMELRKFGRVLDYLSTLDFVDKDRFAFYGLSYGGYTALWIAPGEPRFKVVISSGHFNDWNLKTSDLTEGTSFLFHADHFDMFNFGLLKTFNHSDLAMLCAPRPYMIEVGDKDGIVMSPRRFVDVEMTRVEELYRKLGIPERGRVARFNGPHRIDGTEAYPFLDRWLNWQPANPN
ncbi:MAG TPA: dienelactone hydrolase family protein [Bryobacteraceae bacterium]|nr:dienelactone hydrolase family protein [Bryobacteraceae bacterium]